MKPNDEKPLSRREALAKLAKLSAYSAPTVSLLLTSSLSYAQGSGVMADPGANPREDPCRRNSGALVNNRAPGNPNYPNAANTGGAGNNNRDTTADCGR